MGLLDKRGYSARFEVGELLINAICLSYTINAAIKRQAKPNSERRKLTASSAKLARCLVPKMVKNGYKSDFAY